MELIDIEEDFIEQDLAVIEVTAMSDKERLILLLLELTLHTPQIKSEKKQIRYLTEDGQLEEPEKNKKPCSALTARIFTTDKQIATQISSD